MENERGSSNSGVITMEEREILMCNDSFGKNLVVSLDKRMKEDSKIIRMDNALKRLYMALIIR
jgi:hypothetical protein